MIIKDDKARLALLGDLLGQYNTAATKAYLLMYELVIILTFYVFDFFILL